MRPPRPLSVDDEPWDPAVAEPVGAQRSPSALAAGKAFSFGYAEHAELLRAAGADVVEFDPLTDPLPSDTAALVLPGGFPEQFTRRAVGQRRCAQADQRAGAPRVRRSTPSARA